MEQVKLATILSFCEAKQSKFILFARQFKVIHEKRKVYYRDEAQT